MDASSLLGGPFISEPALQLPIPSYEPWPRGRGGLLAGYRWGMGTIGLLWGMNPRALLQGEPEGSGVLRRAGAVSVVLQLFLSLNMRHISPVREMIDPDQAEIPGSPPIHCVTSLGQPRQWSLSLKSVW